MRISHLVKSYPGLGSPAEGSIDLEGPYVYSRAALVGAIAALEFAIENDDLHLKKLDVEISIEVPCPPICNAYYRQTGSVTIMKDRSLPESEQVHRVADTVLQLLKMQMKGVPFPPAAPQAGSDPLPPFVKHDMLSYGTVIVNDAMADTYLYLAKTRNYFFETLFAPAKAPASEEVPADVITEINSLFHFWDHWHPNDRLDLSKSWDIPKLDAGVGLIKLAHAVIQNHPSLAALLFMVLAHEYAHSLLTWDKEVGKNVGRDLLEHFTEDVPPDSVPSVAPLIAFSQDLLRRDQQVFASWQAEIASDMLGLQWYRMLLPEAKDDVIKALVIEALIFSLIEIYNAQRYSAADLSHPPPLVRFLLNEWVCSNTPGWRHPRDFGLMVEAVNTIMAIRSQCS